MTPKDEKSDLQMTIDIRTLALQTGIDIAKWQAQSDPIIDHLFDSEVHQEK
ncbi:hypothetical protein [Paenibacillus humicola]|uniref:hypothetical protein n=1 Tax=Paenibacillus humicola TaxID=3110540 RepID=UPI00237B01A1|nr:hypothetical protein [Paenibacillus humicola]